MSGRCSARLNITHYASTLAMRRAYLYTVQIPSGYSDPRMTKRYAQHLAPMRLREAVKVLNNRMTRPDPS